MLYTIRLPETDQEIRREEYDLTGARAYADALLKRTGNTIAIIFDHVGDVVSIRTAET